MVSTVESSLQKQQQINDVYGETTIKEIRVRFGFQRIRPGNVKLRGKP